MESIALSGVADDSSCSVSIRLRSLGRSRRPRWSASSQSPVEVQIRSVTALVNDTSTTLGHKNTPGGLMIARTSRRRGAASMRVALMSLLVASGIGVVAVVPALGADNSPASAAFDSDRDRGPGHVRWFRDRGDVRYVWFRLCDGTSNGARTTATTTATTTETIAPDAVAAAVEGAAVETATTTDTASTTDTATTTDTVTTETTAETTTTETTTVAEDAPDAEAYPTFVVVPLSKDEAKALPKLDERPCYDLTTGAPEVTGARTTTDAATTDSAAVTETTTTPVATRTTG
jgi:hypothetical protein